MLTQTVMVVSESMASHATRQRSGFDSSSLSGFKLGVGIENDCSVVAHSGNLNPLISN